MVYFYSFQNSRNFAKHWLTFLPVLLGTASVLGCNLNAKAADQITLKYNNQEETIEVNNLETFVQTGQAERPEVQSFFERAPEAKRLLQELLDAEIYISPAFVSRIEARAKSSTGDFILIQLNKLINSPSEPENLDRLRTALRTSLNDDNRLSLVELIRNYPESDVRLDLTGLEPVYNDVKGFVEKVLPALEVAREYLQNAICDCKTNQSAQTTRTQAEESEGVPVAAEPATSCVDRTAQAQPESQQTEASSTQIQSPAAATATQFYQR